MKEKEYLINSGVDLNASLELFGDINTYNEMLQEFIKTEQDKIKDLKKFKEANDMANYAITVHSLKSDARTFGFTALADMAYEHEIKSKANNMYYVFDHFDELINITNKVLDIACTYLGLEQVTEIEKFSVEDDNLQNILVVDDSNMVRIFIEKVFNGKYNVISALDGKEALELLKSNQKFSAMLLDLNMPNMGGLEVLEYMKENNLLKTIPTSIITGEDSFEELEKASSYPVVEVLTKPFNERDIKRVIEKTLNFNK